MMIIGPNMMRPRRRQRRAPGNYWLGPARSKYGEGRRGERPAYAVFHTGPSATGDIEGVLVHGAQGVRTLTVAFIPRPQPGRYAAAS